MKGLRLAGLVAGAAVAGLAGPRAAGVGPGEGIEFIINDRDADTIWRLADLNRNGQIDEPGEVLVYFSAANAAGTIGPMNPTCLAVGPGRRVLIGDQLNQLVYMLQDLNGDGDALDLGESMVFADQTNGSGASLAFPTGAAFDAAGVAYISNAGNASGADAVYRLVDLNSDGDANDANEITLYVGFGGGNGPYSPQEILLDPCGATPDCYIRNSSGGLQGVYIYQASVIGPGGGPPFFPFFTDPNATGVTPLAGFALEFDPVRRTGPCGVWSLYTLQIAAGGIDQLVRCTQITLDGDANDPGETQIVYSNSAGGFTGVDVAAFPNGEVLVTDASADQIIRLTDRNNDGLFTGANESSVYFANTTHTVLDIRQIAIYRLFCPADLDGDGVVRSNDLALLLGNWGGAGVGDIDGDMVVGSNDLALLLGGWGACP